MYTTLIVIVCIISVLLTLAVLIQNSKGGGLSGEFGGAGAGQMFGVQKTTDLLEQITWGLAAAMGVLVLVSHLLVSAPTVTPTDSPNIEKAAAKTLPAPAKSPIPAAPAAPKK